MPTFAHPWLRLAVFIPALSLLSACDELDALSPTPPREAAGLQKLSVFDGARDVDLAIGPDGTLHAVFSDQKLGGARHVYYRASRDGGATWSEIENLSQVDTKRPPGLPKVAVDSQNRVYVLWKAMLDRMPWDKDYRVLSSGPNDHQTGMPYGTPLVYRVLEQGRWSPMQTLKTNEHVLSWFPSVSPDGQLHVVWSEQSRAADGYQTICAGRIRQTSLSGLSAGPDRLLLDGAPDNPSNSGSMQVFDNYHSLRGYVDGQGTAHWVATKLPALPRDREELVVYWDGQTERTLFPLAQYGPPLAPYYEPASLLLDASGSAHVLVQDVKGDRPGLLDLALDGGAPRPIHRLSDPKGEIKTYQGIQDAQGHLAAMMSLKEGDTTDLFVSAYDAGRWSSPLNLTNNAQRGDYKTIRGGFGNGAEISTSYAPSFGAGVFDASGRLALVAVNDEFAAITTHELSSGYAGTTDVASSGAVNNSNVYFFRP